MIKRGLGSDLDESDDDKDFDPLFGCQSSTLNSTHHKRAKTKRDIISLLQSCSGRKDVLSNELGFSLNSVNEPRKNSKTFENLKKQLDMDKKIKLIIEKDRKLEEKELKAKKHIDKLIKININKDVRLDKRNHHWLSNMKNKFKTGEIPEVFLFFMKKNKNFNTEINIPKEVSFLGLKNKLKIGNNDWKKKLVSSKSSRDIEFLDAKSQFKFNKNDLVEFLSDIGCDIRQLKGIELNFDKKDPLPIINLQLLKFKVFIQKIDLNDIEIRNIVMKSIIFMMIDENINLDLNKENNIEFLKELLWKLINGEYMNELLVTVESTLNDEPILWFRFINNIHLNKIEELDKMLFFKMNLLFKFLISNDYNDLGGNDFKLGKIENIEDLLVELEEYLRNWVNCRLNGNVLKNSVTEEAQKVETETSKNKKAFEITKLRIKCLEKIIAMNFELIKNLEVNETKLIINLKLLLSKFKRNYFKEYKTKFATVVPQCEMIIDSLINRLDKEVNI